MSQIPFFCRKLGCTKPDPYINKETDSTWCFVCRTCGNVQVLSKEHVKNKVAYERELERLGKKPKHSWESQVLYSFSSK